MPIPWVMWSPVPRSSEECQCLPRWCLTSQPAKRSLEIISKGRMTIVIVALTFVLVACNFRTFSCLLLLLLLLLFWGCMILGQPLLVRGVSTNLFRFVFRLQGTFLYRSSHVRSAFSTDRRVNRGLSRLGLCGRFSEGLKTALGTEDWLLQDICPLDDDHRLIGYQKCIRQVVHLVILELQPPHTKAGSGHHGGPSLGWWQTASAASTGMLQCVLLLLEAGAEKDKGRTDIGATPLFIATTLVRNLLAKDTWYWYRSIQMDPWYFWDFCISITYPLLFWLQGPYLAVVPC